MKLLCIVNVSYCVGQWYHMTFVIQYNYTVGSVMGSMHKCPDY